MTSLAERISALVREATDGAISPDGGTPLSELGVDSLGWLRLLDKLEAAFGVELELSQAELRGATVEHLAALLAPLLAR
jgi:acyl carrier protein